MVAVASHPRLPPLPHAGDPPTAGARNNTPHLTPADQAAVAVSLTTPPKVPSPVSDFSSAASKSRAAEAAALAGTGTGRAAHSQDVELVEAAVRRGPSGVPGHTAASYLAPIAGRLPSDI